MILHFPFKHLVEIFICNSIENFRLANKVTEELMWRKNDFDTQRTIQFKTFEVKTWAYRSSVDEVHFVTDIPLPDNVIIGRDEHRSQHQRQGAEETGLCVLEDGHLPMGR